VKYGQKKVLRLLCLPKNLKKKFSKNWTIQ